MANISYKRVIPPSKSDRQTYSGLVPYGCSCSGYYATITSGDTDKFVLIGSPGASWVASSDPSAQAQLSTQCVVNITGSTLSFQGNGSEIRAVLAICPFDQFPDDADSTYLYDTLFYVKDQEYFTIKLPDFEGLVVPSGMNVTLKLFYTVKNPGADTYGNVNFHFFCAVDPD